MTLEDYTPASLFEEYPPICKITLRGKAAKQRNYVGHPDTLYPLNAQNKEVEDRFFLIGATEEKDPEDNMLVVGTMNFNQNKFDEAKLPERKTLIPVIQSIIKEIQSQGLKSRAAVRLSYFPVKRSPETLVKDLQETEWKIQEILRLQRHAIHFRRSESKK